MDAVTHLAPTVGVFAACDFLGVARASFYRQRPVLGPPASPAPEPALPSERPAPARALSPAERTSVLTVLHEERFQDRSAAAVQATLLDEGQYLCSTRTMYRILEQEGESRERRDQLVHPPYQKPELLATAPNQLWSWDITKLLGPAKWTYFYLYVILDVFSRYVAGWMVAHREAAELAKHFIEETIRKHQVPAGQLTIHADRGKVMRSKPVAFLMADLGVTKTHSRLCLSQISNCLRTWSLPVLCQSRRLALSALHVLAVDAAAAIKSRAALNSENLALRHQLGALCRFLVKPPADGRRSPLQDLASRGRSSWPRSVAQVGTRHKTATPLLVADHEFGKRDLGAEVAD